MAAARRSRQAARGPSEPARESVLDRIFNEGRLVRDAHQTDGAREMLSDFISEIGKEGVASKSVKKTIAERIAAIDKLISAQVNHVLHDSKFQKLERAGGV